MFSSAHQVVEVGAELSRQQPDHLAPGIALAAGAFRRSSLAGLAGVVVNQDDQPRDAVDDWKALHVAGAAGRPGRAQRLAAVAPDSLFCPPFTSLPPSPSAELAVQGFQVGSLFRREFDAFSRRLDHSLDEVAMSALQSIAAFPHPLRHVV